MTQIFWIEDWQIMNSEQQTGMQVHTCIFPIQMQLFITFSPIHVSCYTVFSTVAPENVLSGLFYRMLRRMAHIYSMFILHCLQARKIM